MGEHDEKRQHDHDCPLGLCDYCDGYRAGAREITELRAKLEAAAKDYLLLRDDADRLMMERDEFRAKLAATEGDRIKAVASLICAVDKTESLENERNELRAEFVEMKEQAKQHQAELARWVNKFSQWCK